MFCLPVRHPFHKNVKNSSVAPTFQQIETKLIYQGLIESDIFQC